MTDKIRDLFTHKDYSPSGRYENIFDEQAARIELADITFDELFFKLEATIPNNSERTKVEEILSREFRQEDSDITGTRKTLTDLAVGPNIILIRLLGMGDKRVNYVDQAMMGILIDRRQYLNSKKS